MLHKLLFIAAMAVALPGAALAATSTDACVNCHQNPDFMVTNKKLYDYFQQWRASTHGQEDVSCSDCHGGNSKLTDK